jgi:Tfp pilus assembly protein PilF
MGDETDARAEGLAAAQAYIQSPSAYNGIADLDLNAGEQSLRAGDIDAARQSLDRAVTEFENILQQDASNPDAQQGLADAQRDLARLQPR